jgi:gliding motility-associated-like protein
MQLAIRRTKLTFFVACFLFRSISFSQSSAWPYCYLPTALKTTSLTYVSLPVTAFSLGPNIRFQYKVTTPCAGEVFTYGQEVLTIAHPQDPVSALSTYSLVFDSSINITGVLDPCVNLPVAACFTVHYYHADVFINGSSDYTASVTNCCRPIGLVNMNLVPDYVAYEVPPPPPYKCPDACGDIGNAIVSILRIHRQTGMLINSSPQFPDHDTILNVCQNKPFSYAIRAFDPDADSIAYHFSVPRTITLIPHGLTCGPQSNTLFPVLYFKDGFSDQQPAGSTLTLNPLSGLISGSLPDTGIYLLTVNIPEYRGGNFLDSVTRDFYVHVFDCSLLPKPKASVPDSINSCSDFTVDFPNNSTPIYTNVNWNNTTFLWTFGDGDSSDQVNPIHTYADTGTYNLRLIIFPGLYCADTTYSKVVLFPFLKADFTHSDSCSQQSIQFTNTSTVASTAGNINYSKWSILKDSTLVFSTDLFNASYTFNLAPQTYMVYLTVGTNKGCMATDSQYVNIWQSPYPLASHDTILSRGASLQLQANDGNFGYLGQFSWTPPGGLSDPFISDPILNSTVDTTYYVTMLNSRGCSLRDSIHVTYYTGPDIYVPNAFTPNGDGKNDIFRPVPVGISSFRYFRVYNRDGELMYQTSQPFAGWDGNFHGKPAQEGTYVWEVAGTDYNKKPVIKKGTVVLIR